MKAVSALALVFSLLPTLACGQTDSKKPEYFNQNVADSNPLRNEQARELDALSLIHI